MNVKKYRIYCETEAIFVEAWSEVQQTTCPNNNTHTIDPNKTVLVDLSNFGKTSIKQTFSEGESQDSYRLFSFYTDIQPLETKVISLQLPIDVNMFAVDVITRKSNIDDSYDVHVDKNTLIGYVVSNSITNILSVSPTVIEYTKIGFYISLDMVNYYIITHIDSINETITIETSINSSIGDPVYLTYYMIKNRIIKHFGSYPMGTSIIGSNRILKSQRGELTYRNLSKDLKDILINIETTF